MTRGIQSRRWSDILYRNDSVIHKPSICSAYTGLTYPYHTRSRHPFFLSDDKRYRNCVMTYFWTCNEPGLRIRGYDTVSISNMNHGNVGKRYGRAGTYFKRNNARTNMDYHIRILMGSFDHRYDRNRIFAYDGKFLRCRWNRSKHSSWEYADKRYDPHET